MKDYQLDFKRFLLIDEGNSTNTIENYMRDLSKFYCYLEENQVKDIKQVDYRIMSNFMTYLNANHYATSTVNRVMSTLRLFFKYLQLQGEVEYNPTELIQGAKSSKRLPKVILSLIHISEPTRPAA